MNGWIVLLIIVLVLIVLGLIVFLFLLPDIRALHAHTVNVTRRRGHFQGARFIMHELAIAQSIVEAIGAKASECNAAHVKGVRLKIGEASGVVSDSLTFCFEMLTSFDPTLAGAKLLIDTMPHRAYCRYCDREFSVTNFVAQCPDCKKWSNEIVSGTELQVFEMEFET